MAADNGIHILLLGTAEGGMGKAIAWLALSTLILGSSRVTSRVCYAVSGQDATNG